MDLIEIVPNLSEGRRRDVVDRIAMAGASVPGVRLLDVHSDADHHRSVLTLAGPPAAIAESAFRIAEQAVAFMDMREHRGVHPRIGALDVLPFVPLGDATMETCVRLAHEVGTRIGERLAIPVYFYGEAALRPERRLLADVRRGEYEQLLQSMGSDPTRAPDAGPARLGPAGATAVGARRPLVAFNVHLCTSDLRVARAIARAVRGSSGGLPGVQALAFATSRPGIVQVSMNLFDLEATSLLGAVQRVHEEARLRGIEPAESELVGLMPASAVPDAGAAALGLDRLDVNQVIELAMGETGNPHSFTISAPSRKPRP